MLRTILIAFSVCALTAAGLPALAGVAAGLLRHPDVSETQITFVYAGDIWVAPKGGGSASRLSTPAGEEIFPRFSPDGRTIAFGGNYDGNTDIYVLPVTGGVPQRLTHHPMSDRLLDWYPDGNAILYSTSMHSGKQRFNQLYKLSKDGGLPEKLPVPYGEFGTVAADGKTLAYMPISRDFRTWKRYRGGSTTDIWIFDLKTHAAKNVTDFAANDSQPMWHGSTMYFISDRDAASRYNLWAWESTTDKLRQITTFTDFDIRFPAIGPDDIVFENGGRLYLLDLATEEYNPIEIEVVTDRATLKPRAVNVGDRVVSGDISPSGKRALFGARGEVFTVPEEHGIVRDLTRSSGVAERSPAWSPDGKEVAYWSDRSGEYELTVRAADGSGQEQTLTELGPGFRYSIHWSPDSKKLAFIDQAMKIWLFDRDKGRATQIDQALYFLHGALQGFSASWSADSRWLAYARDLDTGQRAIFLFDSTSGETQQVTSGFYDDSSPVFDPDGKYLYLLTGRHFAPIYSDIDTTWVYNNMTGIAAIALRRDVDSPLAPRNDVDQADASSEDEKDGDKDKKSKKDKPAPVLIELDGFENRLVMLPAAPGNYGGLSAVSGKVIYQRRPRTGSADGASSSILYWDLKERAEETILAEAGDYVISADGKSMLVFNKGEVSIVEVAKGQSMDKKLALSELVMQLDPAAEWRQIFNDAWRLERDYFYDPNMHGQDWQAMRKRYGALLEDAVTRWDLDFILGELIGELNASHSYRGGGDMEQADSRGVGLLGCNYELHDGGYRIAEIIDGAAWDSEVRSPLLQPGVNIKQGDYLLAVNGVAIDVAKDPWAAFQGLADKTVMLTVNDKPSMKGARDVLVQTLGDETRLRNLAWIEKNRRYVEEKSGGRIGYIYVPSTGFDGQTELQRMFAPQFMKDSLIIDERFNDGGQIPTRFIELLNRPITNYWGVRDGLDWQWPPASHVGPKAMLINQWSGSGGDCFPYFFRQVGLGPLIGKTTWGGLIGISGAPQLIDGGVVTVPTFSFYDTDGNWAVENSGVAPDIEVVDDPSLMTDGGDPQLDRAIDEMLKALAAAPPKHPKRPENPIRSGR